MRTSFALPVVRVSVQNPQDCICLIFNWLLACTGEWHLNRAEQLVHQLRLYPCLCSVPSMGCPVGTVTARDGVGMFDPVGEQRGVLGNLTCHLAEI